MFRLGSRVLSTGLRSTLARAVHAEAKIAALGLEMPSPAVPKGNFVNFLQIDNMVYLSGHLPQVRLPTDTHPPPPSPLPHPLFPA
mmetsp:Transcript_19309/g.43147  ORF Transcript_19309/g.43147 Transcript_19309/m.43147 type:complete len:85 (+) Transcript_19309:134-388(+)